jgi:hypothetical protein
MNDADSKQAARARAFAAVVALVQHTANEGKLPTNEAGIFGEFFLIRDTKIFVTGRLRPAGNVTVSNFWAVPD